MFNALEKSQISLYTQKYLHHGDAPQALSWNDQKTQFLRFEKIAKLFDHENAQTFSVHEVGCGLGHFYEYLTNNGCMPNFSGNDVVADFVKECQKKYPSGQFVEASIAWDLGTIPSSMKGKDYYCLNGTFHTRENNSVEDWEAFIYTSMKNMYDLSAKGICVNFLTAHADFYNEKLYYARPSAILEWCIKNLSRFVTIAHDVPLYEFFVYVYKPEFMKNKYPSYAEHYIKSKK